MSSALLPANATQPKPLCDKVKRFITHPATQTVASGISLGGSVSVGMLMVAGIIGVNAIPVAGQVISAVLVVFWILGSLYSYFKGVSRLDQLSQANAYRAQYEILHPQVQPSEIELAEWPKGESTSTTAGESDESSSHPYVVEEPGSIEMAAVKWNPLTFMRRLPMGVLTFNELHGSVGAEITRKTKTPAMPRIEEELDEPGNTPGEENEVEDTPQPGLVPRLDLEQVVVEDVTDQPLSTERNREPLHFPHSQERTPPHLSLVPFKYPQPTRVEEVESPRDDWQLVPLSSPLASKGPKVEEISYDEFQRLKIKQVLRERPARRGRPASQPAQQSQVLPAIEGPKIPVNPETLKQREILRQAEMARRERNQPPTLPVRQRSRLKRRAEEPLDPALANPLRRRRTALPSLRFRQTPDSPKRLPSRCARAQEYAWNVLEQGQNLIQKGLDKLPTWVFQRIESGEQSF